MSNDADCVLWKRCSSAPPNEPTHDYLSKAGALPSAAVACISVVGILLQLVRIPQPCITFHAVPNAPTAPLKHCERPQAGCAESERVPLGKMPNETAGVYGDFDGRRCPSDLARRDRRPFPERRVRGLLSRLPRRCAHFVAMSVITCR